MNFALNHCGNSLSLKDRPRERERWDKLEHSTGFERCLACRLIRSTNTRKCTPISLPDSTSATGNQRSMKARTSRCVMHRLDHYVFVTTVRKETARRSGCREIAGPETRTQSSARTRPHDHRMLKRQRIIHVNKNGYLALQQTTIGRRTLRGRHVEGGGGLENVQQAQAQAAASPRSPSQT